MYIHVRTCIFVCVLLNFIIIVCDRSITLEVATSLKYCMIFVHVHVHVYVWYSGHIHVLVHVHCTLL